MKEMVEWELTMKCNFKCEYCTNLDQNIEAEVNEGELIKFIDKIRTKHPGEEIFMFGGEPLLHPKITFIVDKLKENKMKFIIQTNFSKKSVNVLNKINRDIKINISIHPSEIDLETVIQLLKKVVTKVSIETIDIMYIGIESEKYYLSIIKENINYKDILLTPVNDFSSTNKDFKLKEYNKKKNMSVYKNIFNFEKIEREGRMRADVWEDMSMGNYSLKGKKCPYHEKYFLYSADLKEYNCCHRTINTGICNHDKCFLM